MRWFAFLIFTMVAEGGDGSRAPVYQEPMPTPKSFRVVVQEDDYSCGYCALSAIYEAYGIDAKKAALWNRLGTGEPAIWFLADTKGTIQPDLFRVLRQDRFGVEEVRIRDEPANIAVMVTHLDSGHLAMGLIEREETGGLHWVVLTEHQDGTLMVGDSLISGIQPVNLSDYARERLLLSVLVSPEQGREAKTKTRVEHVRGGRSMLETWWGLLEPVQKGLVILAVCSGVIIALMIAGCFFRRLRVSGKKSRAPIEY